MTAREYALLETLMRRHGRIVSRDQLQQLLYGFDPTSRATRSRFTFRVSGASSVTRRSRRFAEWDTGAADLEWLSGLPRASPVDPTPPDRHGHRGLLVTALASARSLRWP